MNRTNCLSHQQLSDYCFGTLSPENADDVAEHVEQCPQCDSTLRKLEARTDTLISTLRQPADDDPYLREPELLRVFDLAAAIVTSPVAGMPLGGRSAGPFVSEQLRDYRLVAGLGQGGMGTVYKAIHTRLDKLVAVKLLLPDRTRDSHAVARFQREMRAVGKLQHPNIVAAHDAGEADGRHYLVMEFVEGLDLSELGHRVKPLGVADACELARQAALGLDYAHHHDLVHRDVKPSNLMLTPDGQVKILDLGLALLQGEPVAGGELTGTLQLMGTTDYMAPEQAGNSHAVDGRADIYSLGCTLYKLLCGRVPFGGPEFVTPMQKLLAQVNATAPPLADRRPGLTAELVAVVERMMAKQPSARFAAAADVAAALAPFSAGSDLRAVYATAAGTNSAAAVPAGALATTSALASGAMALSYSIDTDAYLSSAFSGTDADIGSVAPPQSVGNALCGVPPADSGGNAFRADSVGNALCGVPPATGSALPTGTPTATQRAADGAPPRRRRLLAAAGAAAVLLMGVVIVVKMRDGSTRRFEAKGDVQDVQIINSDDDIANRPTGDNATDIAIAEGVDAEATPAEEEYSELVHWVFGVGGRVAAVSTGAWPGKFLKRPSDLPKDLEQLHVTLLNCREVTDADLKRFKPISKLFELNLGGTRITDAGLAELHSLPNLRVLYLDGTPITREGIEKLGVLPNLEMIRIGGTATTGADLVLLSRFPKLKFVQLGRAQLTDEGVVVLSTLKNIDSLETRDDVGLDEFVRIGNLSQMRHLSAVGATCTDSCLETLSKLTNLNDLALWSTSVSDAGIARIPRVASGLVGLTISGGQLTDAGLSHLRNLPKLETLTLDGAQVTAAGVAELQAALPNCKIHWAESGRTTPLTDADREVAKWVFDAGGKVAATTGPTWGWPSKWSDRPSELPEVCYGLMILLSDCHKVTDADLKRFKSLTKPFWLNLARTKITDAGFAGFSRLPNLHILVADGTAITRVGLENLGVLPNLEAIELSATGTTGADLALFESFPNLTHIGVGPPHLDHNGMKALSAMPTVTIGLAGAGEADLKHLGKLRHLRSLSAGGTQFNDVCLEPLIDLTSLAMLGLWGTSVSDAGVARLPLVAPHLTLLSVSYGRLTDHAVKHLAALRKLEGLNLYATGITEAGVAELKAALPKCKINWTSPIEIEAPPAVADTDRQVVEWVLAAGGKVDAVEDEAWVARKPIGNATDLPNAFYGVAINLADCQTLADGDLKRFQSLTKPFTLSLDLTRITDAGLLDLRGMANLRELHLNGTGVTRAGLDNLGVLSNLVDINLVGTSTKGADLALLSRFPKLSALALGRAHLTDEGAQSLANLPNVVTLYCDGPAEAEVERIGQLSQLRIFSAGGKQFNDACLEPLSGLTNLVTLGLYNTSVTDVGIAKLATVAPRLEWLNLCGARMTEAAWTKLGALTKLKYLSLEGSEVTDDGLEHLRTLINMKQLWLNTCRVGDAGVAKLAALSTLEGIYLAGTDVTDEGLKPLGQLANLKLLDLTNTRVTTAGIAELKAALPACQVVSTSAAAIGQKKSTE